ncbi:MAG: NUDIX domain-containing protein [Tepidiformaceae bacterium]
MDSNLLQFLSAHPEHCEYDEVWPLEPPVPLHARLSFAAALPPIEVRSSVLGIVMRSDEQVLFIHPEQPSGDIAHVLIGGRPNPNESVEQTLIREVGEESGWLVTPHRLLGFRHFRHLGPLTPQMADRPYPDFLQPIYAAFAEKYDATLLLPDKKPCEFVDAVWAVEVTKSSHRPLLAAALLVTQFRED